MKKPELEVAAEMLDEAGNAVEMILKEGIDAAMTKFQSPQASGRRTRSRNVAAACCRQVFSPAQKAPPKTIFTGQRPGTEGRGHHMEERLYDLIFIVRPATPEDEIKKVLTTVEHACTEKGGKSKRPSTGAPASSPIAYPSIARASTSINKSAPRITS